MLERLKITSPIAVTKNVKSPPKYTPGDKVFDLSGQNVVKVPNEIQENFKEVLQYTIKRFDRQMLTPLLNNTAAQTDLFKQLIFLIMQTQGPEDYSGQEAIDNLFIKPEELLNELMSRDAAKTLFRGEFFDLLRTLIGSNHSKPLMDAVASVLKSYECLINRDNSLKAIVQISTDLKQMLSPQDGELLNQSILQLESLLKSGSTRSSEPSMPSASLGLSEPSELDEAMRFLKNDFIPLLGRLVNRYQQKNDIRNQIMMIIHYIVRADRSDAARLEASLAQLTDKLKPMNGFDGKAESMEELLLQSADEMLNKLASESTEKSGRLLALAFDSAASGKVNQSAQNLLLNLIQNESPLNALIHFTLPIRFNDELTYGEFYIDKNCRARKECGRRKPVIDIFFTIRSERYGNFESDLFVQEGKKIEMDIRCPMNLTAAVRGTERQIKDLIENQGYRLSKLQVEPFLESKTILQRFPGLVLGKEGIDVKI